MLSLVHGYIGCRFYVGVGIARRTHCMVVLLVPW